ncbi:MAG: hypothetical protein AAF502_19385 [Bacteroidota bacterium]
MGNLKLIQLIESFDKYERKRFRKFLDSPYFNSNSKVSTLFHFIATGNSQQPPKVYWPKLFPGEAYDDSRFRRLCADLVGLAKHFYAVRQFEKDKPLTNRLFMQTVNRKKLTAFFNSSERDTKRSIDQYPYLNANYFWYNYQFEQEKHLLAGHKLDREGWSNFEEISSSLDQFFLAEKLKLYCEILSWKKVAAVDYDLLFVEDILKHVKAHHAKLVPPVAIYYQMILTLEDNQDSTAYFELKHLLEDYAELFPPEEARNMYACAQNFCIRMINKGNLQFLEETFELYKAVLDRRIIWPNGVLSPYDYKNIVVVALRLKEFEWAENFIHEFKPHLPDDFRENAFVYNLAKFHFYQKNYTEVISLLQRVEYNDVFYNLDSKSMLLKTYYETGEYNAMEALIESFRVLLRRKKVISEHHRANYGNFIKFVQKLIRMVPGDKKAIENLRKSIASTPAIADVEWLLEKV